MVVNGENEKIKQSSDYNPNEWKDKIAYFPWLSYRGECIGILAGACPCEDEETALDWHRKITPLLDMVASLLKSMQQVGKLQRNALNFEAPVEVSLSKREIEVLKLVALGCSSKEVSEQIQVSERTIHSYRQRISQKLKRYSTADLTRYAVMLGLVPLSDRSPNPSS
jgi:DNA-binding CsgD family transcriptional regulator